MPRTTKPDPRVADTANGVEYHAGMKDWPVAMRPRERLLHHGAQYLQDAELLAIILRTGTPRLNVIELSTHLLTRWEGLAGVDRAAIPELCTTDGLGTVKAVEIKAALELGRRLVSLNPGHRARVRSPDDIWLLVHSDMQAFEQEHLRVMLLDTRNNVLGAPDLYVGTVNSTSVRPGELFREAIRRNAAAIALIHNHPSGDPTPSPEDVRLTRDAVQAGRLLDVEVLDHIVVGRGEVPYVSMKRSGLGFPPAGR